MPADIRVSVIVPVRDGERHLADGLASVLEQTVRPEEVIVVDDGSTDRTLEVAARFPVRVLRTQGRGVSEARNSGIAASSGSLIAFNDHDDLWQPDKLERQVAFLEAHPEVGCVFCRIRAFMDPGIERPPWVLDEYLTERGFVGFGPPSMLSRREVFDQIGGFATDLDIGEDADWVLRAMDAGIRHAIMDEPLVRHRVHANNTTGTGAVPAADVFRVLRRATARRHTAAGEKVLGDAHAC
jgi:glycosyltransferase involved in cell wall biosynthesis